MIPQSSLQSKNIYIIVACHLYFMNDIIRTSVKNILFVTILMVIRKKGLSNRHSS